VWRPLPPEMRRVAEGHSHAIGEVIYGDADGNEWVVGGALGQSLRQAMRHDCRICSGEDGSA